MFCIRNLENCLVDDTVRNGSGDILSRCLAGIKVYKQSTEEPSSFTAQIVPMSTTLRSLWIMDFSERIFLVNIQNIISL